MSLIVDWLVAAFVLAGAGFMLIAAIGVARLPDTLSRMQAATKAGAVGVGLIFIAAAVRLPGAGPTIRSLLGFAFVVLTAPIAAQVIARAAYLAGVELWSGTVRDDLDGSDDLRRIVEEPRDAEERW